MRSSRRAVFLLLLSSGIACGRSSTHRVLEPPRLSLAPYPSVWLVSTKTGGTLWRASSRTTEQVGELAIVGGIPYLSATNPNDTYGPMVNKLVRAVTWDLRSTWVDQ